MLFRTKGEIYRGASAVEIVRSLEQSAADYPHRGQSVRQFLRWSLDRLGHSLHPRELGLSDTLGDEALALNYLCLCEEYGAGELLMCHQDSLT
ncbi:MAG TPA: hypothetical protein VN228_18825 [Pyrinomonadaceae bacterium]|nr:hypothetical protein [Pyrinomonadaceae bacterium]